MSIYFIFLFCYFLGAIPFAYIITRLITGKDVRKYGSGNVGATNASRVMGFKYGILVGLLDILKGYLAVFIAQQLISTQFPSYYILLAAVIAIIGHNWSIFLRFSGGKGVATTFGVILRLFPLVFIVYALIWLVIVVKTRYVSLASILAALSLPIIVYIFKADWMSTIFAMLLALFIVLRHHANIKRLIEGRESRMTWPPGTKKGDA